MSDLKKNIKTRFARSIKSYDRAALAQIRIADRLATLLPDIQLQRALEIGSGTGLLTRALLDNYPNTQWYINDLVGEVESMLQPLFDNVEKPVDFIPGDAEKLSFPDHLDMIVSASTIQWFDDLSAFIQKAADALVENGWLVLSTFGPDNLQEIRNITGEGLHYFSLEAIRKIVGTHFKVEIIEQEQITLYFETSADVLRNLKKTGVNGLGSRCWTRKELDNFYRTYEKHYQNGQGVPLTYHPIYVIARKK